MNMLPNDKDKIVRDKLKGLQPEWDQDALWGNIDTHLDSLQPNQKKRYWWAFFPILFIGIGIGWGISQFGKTDAIVQTVTQNNNISTRVNEHLSSKKLTDTNADKQAKNKQYKQKTNIETEKSSSNQQTDTKIKQPFTKNHEIQQTNTEVASSTNIAKVNEVAKVTEDISTVAKTKDATRVTKATENISTVPAKVKEDLARITETKNASSTSEIKEEVSETKEMYQAQEVIQATEQVQEIQEINKTQEVKEVEHLEVAKNSIMTLPTTELNLVKEVDLAMDGLTIEAMETNNIEANNRIDISPWATSNKGFYVNAYGGMALPLRNIKAEIPEMETFVNDLENDQQVLEANEFGVEVGYQFKHWFIETGINRLQINELLDQEQIVTQTIKVYSDTAYHYRNQANERVFIRDTVKAIRTDYTRNKQYFEHNYYNIPLLVGVNKTTKKWNIALAAGPNFNLSYKYEGKFAPRTLDNINTIENTDLYKTNVGISLQSKFILGYRLRAKQQIFTAINYRYFPNSVSTDGSQFSQQYSTVGLSLGYRLGF